MNFSGAPCIGNIYFGDHCYSRNLMISHFFISWWSVDSLETTTLSQPLVFPHTWPLWVLDLKFIIQCLIVLFLVNYNNLHGLIVELPETIRRAIVSMLDERGMVENTATRSFVESALTQQMAAIESLRELIVRGEAPPPRAPEREIAGNNPSYQLFSYNGKFMHDVGYCLHSIHQL
jgi:hypothetical protein